MRLIEGWAAMGGLLPSPSADRLDWSSHKDPTWWVTSMWPRPQSLFFARFARGWRKNRDWGRG